MENKKQAVEELKSFGKKMVALLSLAEELERLGSLEAMEKGIQERFELAKGQEAELNSRIISLEEQRVKTDARIQSDVVAATEKAKDLVQQAEVRASEIISAANQAMEAATKKAKDLVDAATKHVEDTRKELATLLTKKQERTQALKDLESKIASLKNSIAKV